MKRILLYITLLSVAFSCQEKQLVSSDDVAGEYNSVTMIIPPLSYEDGESSTRIGLNLSSLKYLWEEEDVVGIFPDEGSQIYFSMSEGVGQSVATFDGGGWALKKNSNYYSYFPFVADYYIDKSAIPISFIGQTQKGNGNTSSASLGNYCFMVAQGTSDETTGNLTFTYERVQMPFMFVIPVAAGTYTSLDVCAGESVIAVSGTMDAINIDKEIHDAVYSDHLSIGLEDVTFEDDETLIVVGMLPPFNIFGKQLTLNLTKSDGTIVTSSFFGKDFVLGSAYRIAPKLSVYAENTLIDGNGGTARVVITASGTDAYTVSTDVDWLTLETNPTSGSAVINVTAGTGLETVRTGYVIVSREETYNGTTITVQDKVLITQDLIGLSVGTGNWQDDGEDYGGTAQ